MNRKHLAISGIRLAAAVTAMLATVFGASAKEFPGFEFNRPGDILIADQFNNRVIEARPGGRIVWQFGFWVPMISRPNP